MHDMIMWSPGVTLEGIEQQVIIKAYAFYRKNKTATAQSLGISIRTLDNKLEKYEADQLLQTERDYESRQRRAEQLNRARGLSPAVEVPASPEHNATPNPERLFAQPHDKASAQQAMPMPERQEVQTLLPRQTAQGGGKHRR